MSKLSIIIPCHNEEKTLPLLFEDLKNEKKNLDKIEKIDYEIICVNDGSTDMTLDVLKEYSKKYKYINYVSLSRNFGKESAMYAGFKYSTGDYIVVMDADGQDPVSLLPQMLSNIKDGYECVATKRLNRKGEPIIRTFFSKLFYKIINKISDTKIVEGARDYRMFTRKFINSLLQMSEFNRFSKGLFSYVGYKTKYLEYENIERRNGKTAWSFWKLVKYSMDGIIAFSTTPLLIVSIMGIIICFISVIFLIYIIINKVVYDNSVDGWTSLACLITFTSGVVVFSIGVSSQYIARIYSESKGRPIYIVDETNLKGDK